MRRVTLMIIVILAVASLVYWSYSLFAGPARKTIKVGEVFTVELEENPSTGYSWSVAYDQTKLELVKDQATPPATPLPGAPNKHVWEFKAIARGVTKIKFSYSRPWESRPAEKTVEYTLRIR